MARIKQMRYKMGKSENFKKIEDLWEEEEIEVVEFFNPGDKMEEFRNK